MNKVTTFAGLAVLAEAAAWGADCVVEGDAFTGVMPASFGRILAIFR